MSKKPAAAAIKLRGVRHNNLKNFDIDLPLRQLIVITGLSGSGKSSLAFDTLFAEGQRRYIETFSPYARQFFDRMDKPQVDSIEGIPPAIAIEQRNSVKSTRSTVGTMTEICDHMKLLWPYVSQLYCRQCGRAVRKDSPQQIWDGIFSDGAEADRSEFLVTFNLPISEKLSLDESIALIHQQGYQRLLLDGEILRLDDAVPKLRAETPKSLEIVQDRVRPTTKNRSRFIEACEQAYHFGKGKLSLRQFDAKTTGKLSDAQLFSNRLHCAQCDIEYREPSPALFSFNNPLGACPTCRGFGRVITIDYNLALPDRNKTLKEGAVKPWQGGQSAECQDDLAKFCRIRKVSMDVPFEELSKKWQDWVINGDTDYGKDAAHQWPKAWYGIKGYFRWLESKAYKMHVRVLLSRYRSYQLCPDCQGKRFQPDALLYKLNPDLQKAAKSSLIGERLQAVREIKPVLDSTDGPNGLTLADFYQLSIQDAALLIKKLSSQFEFKRTDPLGLVLNEVQSRLGYLNDVGLAYLTMDRPTRSLSGGETERVNLTTCLGSRLVNTLFVLDEPSVGLHARDTDRLIQILEQLRDAGNTVVVVEHESSVMRAADQIVDIGPGHGSQGGQVVFQGPFAELLKSKVSLTGKYLSRQEQIEIPVRKAIDESTTNLTIRHANVHNLKDLTVAIPLGRLVCLTGVSGSGKTTLIRDILLPLLSTKLSGQSDLQEPAEGESAEDEKSGDENLPEQLAGTVPEIEGHEAFGRVVLVDQSSLGKTPRSNPAVYIGAFEDIRETFAQTDLAKQRGLNASAFSFNSGQGQCERCRGAGFEKIEMQFLSDVFVRCPECNGRRYRAHILEITLEGKALEGKSEDWSIADMLEASVDDAIIFLESLPASKPAKKASASLELLQRVGLGYVKLGQPINTLSGGESQRLKLVRHLTEFTHASGSDTKPTLFLFDEPTTGLHFDDVRVLLKVFQDIVDAGHSVLIIEHNLDVIKSADWVIDLGPEAGDGGGEIVATGTPEQITAVAESLTGQALKDVLPKAKKRAAEELVA